MENPVTYTDRLLTPKDYIKNMKALGDLIDSPEQMVMMELMSRAMRGAAKELGLPLHRIIEAQKQVKEEPGKTYMDRIIAWDAALLEGNPKALKMFIKTNAKAIQKALVAAYKTSVAPV